MVKSISSQLKYPPLKPVKLPDKLIWQSISKEDENIHEYRMFTTSAKRLMTASMTCYKTKYDVPPALVILKLISKSPNNGLGSAMLKYAEVLSKRIGCEGRLKLRASSMFTPNRIPHIFYRKYGFTTDNPEIDKKLDKFIKKGADATYKDIPDMLMYYNYSQKRNKSLWQRIKKLFC